MGTQFSLLLYWQFPFKYAKVLERTPSQRSPPIWQTLVL